MKRLWVRLSAVATVIASLGGGGYYLTNSGTAAKEGGGNETKMAQVGGPEKTSLVSPLKDNASGAPPVFDGSYGSVDDNGGFGTPPPEPAQATWRDDASQPIRQVSGSQAEGGYGAGTYGSTGAPAVDPTDSSASPYGADPPYDPTQAYGGADGDAPSYPTTGATTGSIADTDASGAPGYDTGAYGVSSDIPKPDPNQPVKAPSFADGQSVAPSSPAADSYDPAPVVAAAPPVADPPQVTASQYDESRGPRFDASTQPQFDPTAPPASPLRQPLAAPTQPAPAQPPVYQQTPGEPAGTVTVAAVPGARALDGRQTPSISVEKMAPAEVQVGKPAAFKTLVRNTGQVIAKNIVVTDRVPQGTRLVDVTPQPGQAPDGSLVWQFESLAPGEEVLISMEVMPEVEGEIGSLARVTFEAQASVRTVCTKPQLLVEHSTDPKVLIGEDVVFSITISNPGSGDATGIVLEEDVPKGLSHVAGSELEYEIGTLRPGDTRRLELVLKASEAGMATNKLRVRGDANLLAEHATQLEVIAPKLLIGLAGPRRRYLDRQVKYQVAFGNGGTAMARNVELATYLPKGLKFVSTNGKGQYDSRDHAVFWSLDQLAPGQEGAVELVALPVATGEQKLQIEGTADLGLSEKYEHTTVVEAITELVFTVSDTQDPIEVGSETVYEVRIVNNGSKTATNVQVAAILPAELTPLSGEGTSRVAVQGQQVVMEPIERMGPRDEAIYKIKVKGQRAGDHLIDVRLVSDEVPTPVTKQESTKVYADGL